MKNSILTIILFIASLFCFSLQAQMEERGLTRDGNQFVKDSLFVMAEAEYLKSLDIQDFDTNRFNMAFAMLGQEKFDEAIEEWESVEKTSENKILKSYCAYNSGGAFIMQQKNDEAIEKYKQALRYFPKNELARHNYWLLKVVKDQNPQQNQDNQDQNKSDEDSENEKSEDKKDKDGESDDEKDGESEDKKDKDGESEDDKDEESEDEKDDESEDEKDGESEDEKDGESEDEKDGESEDEKDGESEDEKDGESEDEKDKDGESEEGDQEDNGSGEELKEGELSTSDALRLLESLDKEEDKTQEKIKAKLLKGKKRKKHEKDW